MAGHALPTTQIGHRYRRMDEAGNPFGVSIDSQTLEDQTVTFRERDSMQQTRVAWIKWLILWRRRWMGFVRE